MTFEWDEAKAADNLAKHDVAFEQAKAVFRDPFALEFEDDRHPYDEMRMILIGMAQQVLLTVVYTMRGDVVRLISARTATATERRRYHE